MEPPPAQRYSISMTPPDFENAPVFSVDTSPAELLKIVRQYEVDKNMAQTESRLLRRKLADISRNDNDTSNDSNSTGAHQCGHKHKRQRHRHESPFEGSDEGEADASDVIDEHFVYHIGHKFFLTCAPWIRSGDNIFDINVDTSGNYDAAERFENDMNKRQGQLQEIVGLLQGRIQQEALRQRWFRRQFINGLNVQRYNTATRIRHSCASILGATDDELLDPGIRRIKFREEIGWGSETRMYSTIDVPILHKDWDGEYSLSSIFLNPKLMGIYVALIRGPVAGKLFMRGESLRYYTESMARIHSIRNITPGAIATCGILARWALSSDESLQEVGSSTGIRYHNDFDEYLTILETGLRQRKKSVLNIIRQWDEKIFPDSESSLVKVKKPDEGYSLKKAMDALAADSEEEDDDTEY